MSVDILRADGLRISAGWRWGWFRFWHDRSFWYFALGPLSAFRYPREVAS